MENMTIIHITEVCLIGKLPLVKLNGNLQEDAIIL